MNKSNIELLNKEFQRIKKLGFVESTRKGYTGIGKTFEDLLGKSEDRLELPDFNGIEIKTKLHYSKSYISLFNAIPFGNAEYEIKRLRDKYGYPDKDLKYCKVFNSSIYANKLTPISDKYLFKLNIDYKKERLTLTVLDRNLNVIDDESYWPFSLLEEKLFRKLKNLAIVKTIKSTKDNKVFYKYYNIDYYELKDFNTFLKMIESGIIRVTFHIGVFKNGHRKGEIHDRGTCFEIKEENIQKIFNKIEL